MFDFHIDGRGEHGWHQGHQDHADPRPPLKTMLTSAPARTTQVQPFVEEVNMVTEVRR